MRLEIARKAIIAAPTSSISRSLGSGTLSGCALERGLPPAAEASANDGGCTRLTVGSGKSELAGACVKVETDAVPLVERLWATLGVEDAVAPEFEALLGSLVTLEDPCKTDPTESSESAARGLVESNEPDVGFVAAAWVLPSVPEVAEAAGAEPADVKGSDSALEDPAGDELEIDESGPWVLAELLPPEGAELDPKDEVELPGAGVEVPGLVLDDAGTAAAAPDAAAVPDDAGTDAAVPDDATEAIGAAVPDDAGIEAVVLDGAGIAAALLAEAGADAVKLAEGGIAAALLAEAGADAVKLAEGGIAAALLAEAGADAVKLAEAGVDAAELGALAVVAANCWPFGGATRFCAASTPGGWIEPEDPVEACAIRGEPA